MLDSAFVEIDLRPAQDHKIRGEEFPCSIHFRQILFWSVESKARIGRNVIDMVGDCNLRNTGGNRGATRFLHRNVAVNRKRAVNVVVEHDRLPLALSTLIRPGL
jgi:hypothetical protein